MAAPLGNQFWKLRSKHGRDKLFATPELLWEAACEYFEWCDNNPLPETDFRGRDALEVTIPKMRAYTLKGLCLYMDASEDYWKEFRSNCKQTAKEFLPVITRIEEIVYTQKFTGAAAGLLNANLISRELGLADKMESKNIHIGLPDMSGASDEDLDAFIAQAQNILKKNDA